MAQNLKVVDGGMDKQKALEAAISQIDKAFGKGSVMKLGASENVVQIDAISTGAKEGGVGEVVFGLNPDGCSTDTAQEETFGLGGAGLSAGLSSKAQQARAAYLFTRLSIPYPSTKEFRPHAFLSP